MKKKTVKKFLILSLCVLLILSAWLFFRHEKFKEKPLSAVLPVAREEITWAELEWYGPGWVELDPEQVDDLCSLLDGCTVKFLSSSDYALSNFYARAMLYRDPQGRPAVEVMFSEDGRVGINNFHSECLTIYSLIDGGDDLYRFLRGMEK